MEMVLPVLLMVLLPFVILKLEKKIKLVEWLSPVVCCYALGIVIGNIAGSSWNQPLARTASEVSVMLALPLLLLAVDFIGWFKLARTTIVSFTILILSVMAVSLIGGKIFQKYDPEVWKMAGMLVGVYVGGTPNLTAIGKILEIRDEAFIMLNAVDVVLGGMYLLFIMSVGVKLLSKILPEFDHSLGQDDDTDLINWQKLNLGKKILHSFTLLGISIGCVGLSLLISHLTTGAETVSVILVCLTAVALGLSFFKKIRHFEGSQEWGQYLLLIFCVAVGSMANASQIFTGSLWYFAFCGFVLIGSILLHFSCCYLFKIDRDTAIITSIAGIFGPAFVAPMAAVLKNRAILVSGVTTGLVGIAFGNFAGLIVSYLLK